MKYRFYEARRNLRWSLETCAENLHVSVATIRRYERTRPNINALLYLELLSGNLTCFGRRWRHWFVADGKLCNGHDSFYPEEYLRIPLLQFTIDSQAAKIEKLKTNVQLDLFTLNNTLEQQFLVGFSTHGGCDRTAKNG